MRRWRKLLLPFSWGYWLVVFIRNYLYDIDFFKSEQYNFPVICIGNLSVGGTGKTPMTTYVSLLAAENYKTAILSRGYKRITKGFVLADEKATAKTIGDEPFQYYKSLKNISVAVDEDRRHGIAALQKQLNPDVIVLDDAFQHRKVKAGFNVLLTMYGDLYVNDHLLPAGNLRDIRSQAKRADVIVVTKCPNDLSVDEQASIKQKLKPVNGQEVYFTSISYMDRVVFPSKKEPLDTLKDRKVTLVTGIAHPEPLVAYLKDNGLQFEHLRYADHHNFSDKEIALLKTKACVLTTEKDYARLGAYLENACFLPIGISFISGKEQFDDRIMEFIKTQP
ncbi:tetraacyldisaccharide 4'-kinase [Galbibacter sp. EGI 63066]|uniref:tetraacyldisaccharide 4'-kinase n=1 Tax=Galbibacter sp. EGI 63066 TaxID=2993559 RepID=UPI0022495832|nr:tetraacyldisaccharide 4'-kinase [Galbibacter sp. EGI 63066]MCX2681169.1 tetraacyldisaccharide 4'-kinase [Galbibacter sp. EGI 63066]